MKTTLAILSSLLVLGQSAHATLFFEEGFNYPVGNLGANLPWSSGNNNIQVASGNLTFAGLADAANPGYDMTVTSGVSAGSIAASFASSSVTSGSIYYAFLAKCTALPTANNYLTSLLPANATGPNGGSDPLAVYVGQSATSPSSFKLGVRHQGIGSGATYFTDDTDFILNNVNLFVVKYTFGPSTADDSVSLFVNPLPGGSEPVAAVTVSGGGTDAANLQVVGFKAQSSAAAGNWTFDTLRIGDTWADVVPMSVPEPSCSLLALLGVAALAARRRFSR